MRLAGYSGWATAFVGVTLPLILAACEGDGVRRAVVLAALLALANALVAFALVEVAEARPAGAGVRLVLGGMGLRLAVLLGALAFGLWRGLPQAAFVGPLACYYVVFLVFELAVLHRRDQVRAER